LAKRKNKREERRRRVQSGALELTNLTRRRCSTPYSEAPTCTATEAETKARQMEETQGK